MPYKSLISDKIVPHSFLILNLIERRDKSKNAIVLSQTCFSWSGFSLSPFGGNVGKDNWMMRFTTAFHCIAFAALKSFLIFVYFDRLWHSFDIKIIEKYYFIHYLLYSSLKSSIILMIKIFFKLKFIVKNNWFCLIICTNMWTNLNNCLV